MRQYGPKPGWYGLSVNQIYDRNCQYHYFQQLSPVEMVGYSIYIYHITEDEANHVRRELGLPQVTEASEREKEQVGHSEGKL